MSSRPSEASTKSVPKGDEQTGDLGSLMHRVLVESSEPGRVLDEVERMMADCRPDLDMETLRRAFGHVERLFHGLYPGYHASNTRYHDFEHTCCVLLAAGRLIYGAMAEGLSFSPGDVLKGLLAALFHDVGLIQEEGDNTGTGAKHTVGHEDRSILFMEADLRGDLPAEDVEDIADCIRSTVLKKSPSTIAFRNGAIQHMGFIVGSADLLAQISHPGYPAKLLLLFEEFEEAGISEYRSVLDFVTKTRNFYEDVARKRLDNELNRACGYIHAYFRDRWGQDRDFYEEGMLRNLEYLDSVLRACKDDRDCLRRRLTGTA